MGPIDASESDLSSEVPSEPYVRFASLVELHDLPRPSSDSAIELQFILITQVKELLFRMTYVEIDSARTFIGEDELKEAIHCLARAARLQRSLLASWEWVNGMSAVEFSILRPILGAASGSQSFMYRALEYILGNKDREHSAHIGPSGTLSESFDKEATAPSLYDACIAYLHRHVQPIAPAVISRDFASQYEASSDVEEAWLSVYQQRTRFADEYALAEQLLEVAFLFSQWRCTHLLIVERMIGSKSGTAGTEGADWLRHVGSHRFFPELWTLRSRL